MLPADPRNASSYSKPVAVDVASIHKIKHVVIIMQENRSFDSYFGTYPGADGIPPGVCVPDPMSGGCVAPFHESADQNYGGPHGAAAAAADIDGGQMDGFVAQAEQGAGCQPNDPTCSPCNEQASSAPVQQSKCVDVMGYHDAREIPNYWTYAHDYVLQDQMFEPNASWSLPAALYKVSEWSAYCTDPTNAFSCRGALENPNPDGGFAGPNDGQLHYAWTDMTYLLHNAGVSWGYYVFKGTEPDCENDAAETCAPVQQGPQTPGIWNPLPSFTDVSQDGQLGNIQLAAELLHGRLDGDAARRLVGRAERHRLRASAVARERGADLRHRPGQRDHAQPGLGQHRDLPLVGRLGRVLRPRRAARRRPERARSAGARNRDQPIRPARIHRPPDPQPRRLQQVHRGRLPRRCAA